jgi:hypothetical protein
MLWWPALPKSLAYEYFTQKKIDSTPKSCYRFATIISKNNIQQPHMRHKRNTLMPSKILNKMKYRKTVNINKNKMLHSAKPLLTGSNPVAASI